MQSAAPELIDLSGETKETLDMYGVGRDDNAHFGRETRPAARGSTTPSPLNCLLARRLVERGVRFVNLYHASWDHHSNLDKELAFNCGMADQPVAALLKDLKRRGLLDSTLVVWMSEFGRTPLGREPRRLRQRHRPRPSSVRLHALDGRRRRQGRPGARQDATRSAGTSSRTRSTSTTCTPPSCTCSALDHLKLTYRFQGRDFRLTDVAGKVVDRLLA